MSVTLETRTFTWDRASNTWRDSDGNETDLPVGKFTSEDGVRWRLTVGKAGNSFLTRWYDDFFDNLNIVLMLAAWIIITTINGWSMTHSAQAFGSSVVAFAFMSALRAWRKGQD